MTGIAPCVAAVSRASEHGFSKPVVGNGIVLLGGFGVEGDAHCGETVKHRSRVAIDPAQPNLRQIHLIQAELLEELAKLGFFVAPGDLGENILTCGVDLLGLSRGTVLRIGAAEIEVTGLRNPCAQIERFQTGLLAAVLGRASDGSLVRKCGIMGIVRQGGLVFAGAAITILPPAGDYKALAPV